MDKYRKVIDKEEWRKNNQYALLSDIPEGISAAVKQSRKIMILAGVEELTR